MALRVRATKSRTRILLWTGLLGVACAAYPAGPGRAWVRQAVGHGDAKLVGRVASLRSAKRPN